MDKQGLQSGTTSIETADVLKDFMMAPTAMQMQMHGFGTMFAPHDKLTLMAMMNYRLLRMEMEGAHLHKEGDHGHPVGHHEMSSSGFGDAKFEALLTLWKRPHLTLLGNIGISFPTGSISKNGEEGNLLPYPMQLGSGSFENPCLGTSKFHTCHHRRWVLSSPWVAILFSSKQKCTTQILRNERVVGREGQEASPNLPIFQSRNQRTGFCVNSTSNILRYPSIL